MLVLGMASFVSHQHLEVKYLTQKLEAAELKNLMLRAISNTGICNWQVQGKVLDLSTTTTVVPSPTVVDLGELREGLTNTTGLLAKAGEPLPGSATGLTVERVYFKNVFATGNPDEFKGTFEVQFTAASMVHQMHPVQVQQIISTVTGDPVGATRISSCELKGVCPAGYVMVGPQNGLGSFCIETTIQPGPITNWYVSRDNCLAQVHGGFGRSHLCTWDQWKSACLYGAGLTIGTTWEWVSESYNATNTGILVGNTSCNDVFGFPNLNGAASNFRCCIGN